MTAAAPPALLVEIKLLEAHFLTSGTVHEPAEGENGCTPARHYTAGIRPHRGLPVNTLQQLISNTPLWVWVLLVFLITRGIAAMKPAETSLTKLATVPALFTVWGLWSISHRFGSTWGAWGEWLVGIGVGMALGWLLLRRATLTLNAATGKLWRSADYSLLPLLLVTFAVKYGFEVALSVAPSLAADGGFRAAYLLLSGGFTGIFIGKYWRYLRASRVASARREDLGGVH